MTHTTCPHPRAVYSIQMIELNELERAVLAKLLEREPPLLEQLRGQLPTCRVIRREFTGVGFFTHLDVGDAPASNDVDMPPFGDVIAEIDGLAHGAGFVLYIEHGRLAMLEGYSYDEPWPDTIVGFSLKP